MKSCLNCIYSGFLIERNNEFYSYEGDCNNDQFPTAALVNLWQCQKDDKDELREEIDLIFEQIATKCEAYIPTT
jgi:hypothetical protein